MLPSGSRVYVVYDDEDLRTAIGRVGSPIVVKPVGGNHGRGATINVHDMDAAIEALRWQNVFRAESLSSAFITGYDHRLLVIDYKFVAAAKRTPAMVTGDGEAHHSRTIDITNSDPGAAMVTRKC